MKRIMFLFTSVISIVVFIIFGCSKKESPSSPVAPTATLTATVTATYVETSTPAPDPNISGNLYLPASAAGKQFIVIVDDDSNTENGYKYSMNGVCQDASTINYSIQVPDGTYYVYAYVDNNGSGLGGPDGGDYFGAYGSAITTPNSSVDITLTQLPITVTLNVTVPGDVTGKGGMFGIFPTNGYEIFNSEPPAWTGIACPSGENFQVSFTMDPADAGTYYVFGFIDADGNKYAFPAEGDYLKIYGGSGVNWPASPNVTINNDITLNLALENVVPNVTGNAYLPASVSNKEYTIFLSTVPLGGDMSGVMLMTKTAKASGSVVNYSIFDLIPGKHYITFMMDIDGSGWNNSGNGPINEGDYAGMYGVPTPIVNWLCPFPLTPNANLPGNGFNIYCDTFPGDNPPSTPTPIPTPTPGGQTGTITVNFTIPSGQTGKRITVWVDMDLDPNDNNQVAFDSALVAGSSQQFVLNNIPVGSYYIYGATQISDNPPAAGDAVGIYGTTFPAFPSSPNANVTNGGNLTANITMVVATNNVSGRVYMPYSCPGKQWAIVIDTDIDGGNNLLTGTFGTISGSNTYFDYSMFLPLPGNYYIYTFVDYTGNGLDAGPNCGDFMGFYNFPNPVYMTPNNNYTNIDIITNDWMLCPW